MIETVDANVHKLTQRLTNTLHVYRSKMQQLNLRSRFTSHNGRRDYGDVLGYPDEVTPQMAEQYYRRRPVMHNAIGSVSEDSWKLRPIISEDGDTNTPFTKAFDKLALDLKLWTTLMRVDKLAGMGEFSILHLGLNDAPPDAPMQANRQNAAVNRAQQMGALGLTPYGQADVTIKEWETDQASEWYLMPSMYELNAGSHMGSAESSSQARQRDASSKNPKVLVHRSRIIHVVEEKLSNDVYGVMRAGVIFDDVLALLKIVGGSAEASWLNIAQKYVALLDTETDLGGTEEEQLQALMGLKGNLEAMRSELQSFVVAQGLKDLKPVSGDVHDPAGAFGVGVRSVSAGANKPARMIVGNEAGELASTQDLQNYASTIQSRQKLFCEPEILRPTVARWVWAGVLPAPTGAVRFGRLNPETGDWEWPSIFVASEKEKSEIDLTRSRTMYFMAQTRAKFGIPMTDDEIRGRGGLPPMEQVEGLRANQLAVAKLAQLRTHDEVSPYETLLAGEDAERLRGLFNELLTVQLRDFDLRGAYRAIRRANLNVADADFAQQIRPIVAEHLPVLDVDSDELLALLFVVMLLGRNYGAAQGNRQLTPVEALGNDLAARGYVTAYIAALLGGKIEGTFDSNADPRDVPAADAATAAAIAALLTQIMRDEAVGTRVSAVEIAYNQRQEQMVGSRSKLLATAAVIGVYSAAQYFALKALQPTHKQRLRTLSLEPRARHLEAVGEIVRWDEPFSVGDSFPPEWDKFIECKCGFRALWLTDEQVAQMGVA